MKLFSILMFLQIATLNLKSQLSRNVNLIIVINEKIVVSGISDFRVSYKNDSINNKAKFYPGCLSMNDTAYNKLTREDNELLLLKFEFSEYKESRVINFSYEVEVSNSLFKEPYFILHIYNLSKRKYKRKYLDFNNKGFVYEIDSPSYTTRLVQNR